MNLGYILDVNALIQTLEKTRYGNYRSGKHLHAFTWNTGHIRPGLDANQSLDNLTISMSCFESDFESESIFHNTYIMHACKASFGGLRVTSSS
jgi:hypothetical protein